MPKDKTMAESITDKFRLELDAIDLLDTTRYKVLVDTQNTEDGKLMIYLSPEYDEKRTLRLLLSEDDILRLHEKLILGMINMYTEIPRHRLNDKLKEILDKFRV